MITVLSKYRGSRSSDFLSYTYSKDFTYINLNMQKNTVLGKDIIERYRVVFLRFDNYDLSMYYTNFAAVRN